MRFCRWCEYGQPESRTLCVVVFVQREQENTTWMLFVGENSKKKSLIQHQQKACWVLQTIYFYSNHSDAKKVAFNLLGLLDGFYVIKGKKTNRHYY